MLMPLNWNSHTTVLKIKLNDLCNYNCSYCFFNHRFTKNLKFITLNIIDNILKSKFSFSKNVKIYVYGGEPTLHKDFIKIVKKLSNLGEITIQSNGSFNEKIISEISNKNIKFAISVHHEFAKINDIIFKAQKLKERNMLESIDLMITKDNNLFKFYKVLKKKFKDVDIQCVFQDIDKINNKIIKEQDKTILFNNKLYSINEMIKNKFTNFFNCECFAGVNHFVISSDGKIWRCDEYHCDNLECLGDLNFGKIDFKKLLWEKRCKSNWCFDYWNPIFS